MNTVDLDLPVRIIQGLKKANLKEYGSILRKSNHSVQILTGLPEEDVIILKDQISEKCFPNDSFLTALDIFKAADKKKVQWKLSSKCAVIDDALRGGILSGVLSEVTGESASGKTQLCLQLCLSVQTNLQCSGGAVYICTEDAFPSKRLQDMIRHNKPTCHNLSPGDHVFVEHVADFDMLEYCIKFKLPILLGQKNVRLVVIDSVTALFRCQYDVTQTIERAKHLNNLSSSLHKLAVDFNIPIICVNQVSSCIGHGNQEISGINSQTGLTPSLGLAWANQITCRLMLSKSDLRETGQMRKLKSEEAVLWTYRKLNIIFAPHLPKRELPVYIDHSGIHGLICDD